MHATDDLDVDDLRSQCSQHQYKGRVTIHPTFSNSLICNIGVELKDMYSINQDHIILVMNKGIPSIVTQVI